MRLGSRAFWFGIAIGFIGAFLLMSTCVAVIGLMPGRSGGATTIDYEPIALEEANSLIDSGQVYRVAIWPERNVDEFWLQLYESSETLGPRSEPSRQWQVTGVEIFVFTESMPHGAPILSDDEDEVGLTADQLEDLMQRIKQYNAIASSRIEVLDQRGGSDSLTVPQ